MGHGWMVKSLVVVVVVGGGGGGGGMVRRKRGSGEEIFPLKKISLGGRLLLFLSWVVVMLQSSWYRL